MLPFIPQYFYTASVLLAEIAERYMRRMGYGEQPYVVYLHRDIDREHIHIIACRIDRAGKKIEHDNEGKRSRPIMREFEKEYGLYRVEKGKEREEDVNPDLWDMKKVDYPRGDVKARVSSVVRSAVDRYRNQTNAS